MCQRPHRPWILELQDVVDLGLRDRKLLFRKEELRKLLLPISGVKLEGKRRAAQAAALLVRETVVLYGNTSP
jgi:hypothetical protein